VQPQAAAALLVLVLVLVLEDLHWADTSTLDLVVFLAHNIGGRPVLLLATYRADELSSAERMRRLAEGVRRSSIDPAAASGTARASARRYSAAPATLRAGAAGRPWPSRCRVSWPVPQPISSTAAARPAAAVAKMASMIPAGRLATADVR
jgi:hypothetical protein